MTYAEKKEQIRQQAIDWFSDFWKKNCSQSELADAQTYFEKMGKRYGLLREFRENAIC